MEDRPALDQINVVVRDMGPMVEFYRLLGVVIDEPEAPWDQHHRTAGDAGRARPRSRQQPVRQAVERGVGRRSEYWCSGSVFVGRDTVDEIYACLTAAGHTGQQPPYDAFWGAWYAIVTDPDGNAVGMSRADPARRTRPPDPA